MVSIRHLHIHLSRLPMSLLLINLSICMLFMLLSLTHILPILGTLLSCCVGGPLVRVFICGRNLVSDWRLSICRRFVNTCSFKYKSVSFVNIRSLQSSIYPRVLLNCKLFYILCWLIRKLWVGGVFLTGVSSISQVRKRAGVYCKVRGSR